MNKLIEVKTSNGRFVWVNPDYIKSIQLVSLGFGFEDFYNIVLASSNYIEVSKDEFKRLMERGFNYIQPHPDSPDDIIGLTYNYDREEGE